MKLYYFFDAYCGWCYGFDAILEPFVKAHPEIEIQLVSGGLFTEGNAISAFPHIPMANQRITQAFGVKFGENYQKLLQEGSFVPNSLGAAIGFGILREKLEPREALFLLGRMQKAFYVEGKSLSSVETYKELAQAYGLDAQKVEEEFQKLSAEMKVHPDFLLTKEWNVQSFPTLWVEKDKQKYELRGNTVEELHQRLEIIKTL